MRIYYLSDGGFSAGGQFVNLDHVAALRGFGLDASVAFVRPDLPADFAPRFPPGRAVPWQRGLPHLTADDTVVISEAAGYAALALGDTPARRVIHNQNAHYTFEAFLDMNAIRRWGAVAILTASEQIAGALRTLGWDGPLWPVRPFVDPVFRPPEPGRRGLRVAFMPRKRPIEPRLIRGALRSRHPDVADVAWIGIAGVDRAEVARRMQACELFLSLSACEGLGLPPLEAMATGALVVGYHGRGGLEYATRDNGDWFDDHADPVEIADVLAARLRALQAGERFTARRRTGLATAAAFSHQRFEAELRIAWEAILRRG